ncbi:PP2C family protein-serine/threonine phosphatase [Actinomadura kijaniata]|uniref:PP2C family protein-serine/threonine phosphatase n=1 Tax=Actinomadura kijaniata TaxID=46161 RepID=UPI003F1BB3AF
MMTDRLSTLDLALWQARPHAVADAAREALTTAFDARGVTILLVDYQVSHLVPAAPEAEPFPIENTLPGRAFASQQTVHDERPGGHELHLPLSIYGDRLGVLTVAFERPPGPDEVGELTAAATVLARALAVADTRTDVFRRMRRSSRLTLAAEIQWELLPGRACVADEFELAGQLEPAYTVWGDNFDWSAASDHLVVSVTNGMGQGIEAALLTQLTIGALRNARRSGADLPEQAALANEAICAQHGGNKHVGTLLLRFDLESGQVRAIDAGSPRIYRMRGGAVAPITLDQQLPLGMFNDTEYVEQEFSLLRGDRLVIVSDGMHDSLSGTGEPYGTFILPRALARTRMQNPPEVVRTLVRELLAHTPDARLSDDAVIVCLDWTGRVADPATAAPSTLDGEPEPEPV